jgi:hypothetical protein
VSAFYLNEALQAMSEWGKRGSWSPVPFCLDIDRKGALTEVAACEPFYRRFPRSPRCAVQNLSPKDRWDPDVLKVVPSRVASQLTRALKRRGCRWLMLDMESLRAKDRDRFSVWSATLVRTLRREIPDLQSSIAVHGKIDAKGDWSGAEAQDWPTLCRDHDELMIMAYDYHYPGATPPGEAAPLNWVEGILRYGVSVCPKRKLRLGLAAYGYLWPKTEILTEHEAKAHPRPGTFVETDAQREEKIALARRFGVDRFFLWAMGMD